MASCGRSQRGKVEQVRVEMKSTEVEVNVKAATQEVCKPFSVTSSKAHECVHVKVVLMDVLVF